MHGFLIFLFWCFFCFWEYVNGKGIFQFLTKSNKNELNNYDSCLVSPQIHEPSCINETFDTSFDVFELWEDSGSMVSWYEFHDKDTISHLWVARIVTMLFSFQNTNLTSFGVSEVPVKDLISLTGVILKHQESRDMWVFVDHSTLTRWLDGGVQHLFWIFTPSWVCGIHGFSHHQLDVVIECHR